jgi:hypothetical protein
MKKIALALVTAAAVFTAVPAMAQVGFYAGPGGIGFQFGPPHHYYYDYDYGYTPYRYYYDYDSGPVVTFRAGPGWHHERHDYRW